MFIIAVHPRFSSEDRRVPSPTVDQRTDGSPCPSAQPFQKEKVQQNSQSFNGTDGSHRRGSLGKTI